MLTRKVCLFLFNVTCTIFQSYKILSIFLSLSVPGQASPKRFTSISTLLGPMEFSIKFYTVKSRRSIVYIKGPQVIISKTIVFLSLKINFVLANSADPDEMLHSSGSSLFAKVGVSCPLRLICLHQCSVADKHHT